MNQSEHQSDLADALNKFQSGLSAVKKGTKNPFFKSNYATLDAIQKALNEPLHECGLSYTQSHEKRDGEWIMVTRVMHKSGQWIETQVPAPVVPMHNKQFVDPQAVGSANTYAKRYGLTQAFGIPTEDDDGNAASAPPKGGSGPSQPQIKRLFAIIGSREQFGWSADKVKHFMQRKYGIESTSQLNPRQYDELCNIIETKDWETI